MASVRKFVNGGANMEGNLPLLQTWYYEKWRVHQLDSTISYASRLRPLIQNWNDEKARKVDNIINKKDIGVGEYVDDLLRPFNAPRVGTPVKPKNDVQDKALIGRVLANLKEVASIDEEDRAIAAPSKESLKNVHNFIKSWMLRRKHLQCITMTDGGEDDKWLGVDAVIEIMRHDHPKDIRDGQLVYIERVAGVGMLKRDGKVENCHEAAFAVTHGITKGDNYLRHDLLLIPWTWQIRGVKGDLRASLRINGPQSHAWKDINVAQRTVMHVLVPRQDDSSSCALYMPKNIKFFTAEDLTLHYDQAYIDNYRRELPIVLLNSPYNKLKSMIRLKTYNASLSDAAAVEDHEDARS
ncbi:hypothetical protein D1007_18364 [Hordeum vulgare]|nr:hypothetical protein D1007_18364 [Hordeum vulgare]